MFWKAHQPTLSESYMMGWVEGGGWRWRWRMEVEDGGWRVEGGGWRVVVVLVVVVVVELLGEVE